MVVDLVADSVRAMVVELVADSVEVAMGGCRRQGWWWWAQWRRGWWCVGWGQVVER